MRVRLLVVAWACGAMVACGGDDTTQADPAPQQSPSDVTTAPAVEPAPEPVTADTPVLPDAQSIRQAGGEALEASTSVDWVRVANGKTWVSGLGRGVGVYAARTGRSLGSVAVPQGPCASMTSGFGAVWTLTCDTLGVARIDARSRKMTGHVPLPVSPEGESTVGAGEGAVWAVIDGENCVRCLLARIDPESLEVTDRFPLSFDATAVRAGQGGVWLAAFSRNVVIRLDPTTGEEVARIAVAQGPRFLDVGDEGVWVMAQAAGALCQIDPADNSLVGCAVLDPGGVRGGDLTLGDGFVWFRGTSALVAQVDAASGALVRRIGAAEGSGSAAAGAGQLWISAHDVSRLYRVPVDPPRG